MFISVHLCDRDKVEEIGLGSGAETSFRAGLCSGILLHGVYCRMVFKVTVVCPIIVFLKIPFFSKSLNIFFFSFSFVPFLYLLLLLGRFHFCNFPLFSRNHIHCRNTFVQILAVLIFSLYRSLLCCMLCSCFTILSKFSSLSRQCVPLKYRHANKATDGVGRKW